MEIFHHIYPLTDACRGENIKTYSAIPWSINGIVRFILMFCHLDECPINMFVNLTSAREVWFWKDEDNHVYVFFYLQLVFKLIFICMFFFHLQLVFKLIIICIFCSNPCFGIFHTICNVALSCRLLDWNKLPYIRP